MKPTMKGKPVTTVATTIAGGLVTVYGGAYLIAGTIGVQWVFYGSCLVIWAFVGVLAIRDEAETGGWF
jgi:hypothetical protein